MPSSIGRRRAAASASEAGDVQATTTGGGTAGLGTTGTERNRKASPDHDISEEFNQVNKRSNDSAKPCSKRESPVPNTSRSIHGPPLPTPSRNRPPETSDSSAACSARATGCWLDSTLTAVPTSMREVAPRTN